LKIDAAHLAGMRVTIMGLGINGGGLASARFFARRGARVTVTDLRSEKVLGPAMEELREFPVRYVLERHEEEDFSSAELVIKNPAVAPSSPYLQAARERGVPVETDLSVFFSLARNPVLAVTGSKGKSTTASAVAFALSRAEPRTRLGGNITVSPLSFLDDLAPDAPVVLELSSWQLGDLRGRGLLKPAVSGFTVVLPDHLDKYPGMREYVEDKKVIFLEQEPGQCAVFNRDDPWQQDFPRQTRARPFFFTSAALPADCCGAWWDGSAGLARLQPGGITCQILGDAILRGSHNRQNLLCGGLMLALYGLPVETVRDGLAKFPGVEHRLELVGSWAGISFFNDSAATIPQATVAAVKALDGPLVLITGGTDKNIDFSPLREVLAEPRAIVLLAGTGTDKILGLLREQGTGYEGPYESLAPAVEKAVSLARALRSREPAEAEDTSVLFSPGCTSFGMFLNEFDRGRKFKAAVRELTGQAPPSP